MILIIYKKEVYNKSVPLNRHRNSFDEYVFTWRHEKDTLMEKVSLFYYLLFFFSIILLYSFEAMGKATRPVMKRTAQFITSLLSLP